MIDLFAMWRFEIYAFYDESFSFADLIKANPNLSSDLTDCLIGDVFNWTTNGSHVIVGDFNGGTNLQREFLYVRITRKRDARAEVI